jgi:hypothetical protein
MIFVGPLLKIFMLSQNVGYIDAYTMWELFDDFRSKRRFWRHEYLEYRKLISSINIPIICQGISFSRPYISFSCLFLSERQFISFRFYKKLSYLSKIQLL